MTQEKTSPLRERMIEDMRIHGMGDKAQKAHIRAIKDFAGFLKRSPDMATPDDLRAYQLHMTDTGVTPTTYNARRYCQVVCRRLRRMAKGRIMPPFRRCSQPRG